MYFLARVIIFAILLPICYASNCTDCGYGYCLELGPNSTCIACACPTNFSGDCCEVQPADGCTPNPCPTTTNEHYKCVNYSGGQYQCVCADGYYGANCSGIVDFGHEKNEFYHRNFKFEKEHRILIQHS
jgi:hypothetical protein